MKAMPASSTPRTPEVRVRRAAPADAPALAALEAAFPEIDRFDARAWRRLLAGHSSVFLAEADGQPAGAACVLFRKGAKAGRLYSLSVADRARGRGIGAALLAACEADASARGCNRMRLEVRQTNVAAIALYERTGFRIVAHLDRYYPDGVSALRMQKPLVAAEGATP